MSDEVKKNFVRSFVSFLKNELGANDMAADAQESVEVAVQCLQAAFDIEEDESAAGVESTTTTEATPSSTGGTSSDATATADPVTAIKKMDLFELYENTIGAGTSKYSEIAETIKNEANRLMGEGKYNEALIQYNRAIALDPKNPIYYCNRAAAHIKLNENLKAVADCKSALIYNPNYSKAYGRLCVAYSNLAKVEEAQQAYEKAIELDPNNENLREQLASLLTPNFPPSWESLIRNPTFMNAFSNANINFDSLRSYLLNPNFIHSIAREFMPAVAGDRPGVDIGAGLGAGPEFGVSEDRADPAHILNVLRLIENLRRAGGNNQSGTQPPPS